VTPIDWLLERFRRHEGDDAVVWKDRAFRYGELLSGIAAGRQRLEREGVRAGDVVMLDADFSPGAIAFLPHSQEHSDPAFT